MTTPAYLSVCIVAGCLGVQAAIFTGLKASVARARALTRAELLVSRLLPAALGFWFVLALALTASGFFQGTPHGFPTIAFGLATPILLGMWLISSAAGRRLVSLIPARSVIGVQVVRLLGVVFLLLYGVHQLPGAFAWPAGVGDVVVGSFAPIVALRYARRPLQSRAIAVSWNVFGLLDLLIAVTTGFLTSPSDFQLLARNAPNELIGAFPLALIPVYLVPICFLLHLVSLRQIKAATDSSAALPTGDARRVPAVSTRGSSAV